MDVMKYSKQKKLARQYAEWMYDLLADGRFYDLPMAKKIKDLPAEYSFRDIGHKHVRFFDRIKDCGNILNGYYNVKTKKTKVTGGIFCGHRVCPICAIRRSLREYSQLTFQMQEFGDKYDYFMIGLTLPNNDLGFREELAIMSKGLNNLLRWFGFRPHDDNYFSYVDGAYGSFEITNIGHGWHPHLHLIIAIRKEYVHNLKQVTRFIDGRERHFINNMELYPDHPVHKNVKHRVFNNSLVIDKWIEIVQNITDQYDIEFEKKHFLNIGFEKCYNYEDGLNELTKYLIDFEALKDANDLYVYLRDSYGVKQRVKRGCFKWTDEMQEKWLAHFEEDKNFVQSEEWVSTEIIFKNDAYYAFFYRTVLEQVAYTNTFKEKTKYCIVKIE